MAMERLGKWSKFSTNGEPRSTRVRFSGLYARPNYNSSHTHVKLLRMTVSIITHVSETCAKKKTWAVVVNMYLLFTLLATWRTFVTLNKLHIYISLWSPTKKFRLALWNSRIAMNDIVNYSPQVYSNNSWLTCSITGGTKVRFIYTKCRLNKNQILLLHQLRDGATTAF